MRKRLLGTLAIAALVLAACGGDDDSGGGDGGGGGDAGGAQGEVADMMMEQAGNEGMGLDEDCVNEVASKLSDEDAQKLVDAGTGGDAELSPEGEARGLEMISCVDTDALVDQIVSEMGSEVDADCLKDAFKDIDPAEMNETNSDFAAAMMECMDLGG